MGSKLVSALIGTLEAGGVEWFPTLHLCSSCPGGFLSLVLWLVEPCPVHFTSNDHYQVYLHGVLYHEDDDLTILLLMENCQVNYCF
ncbi:hypothetical protein PanWU01x14_173640 [Parasponia andersonii]|uniref:Uncharacterized protein n=1 Tax=Parasponia andersonii TaxID=3476 RepID=A0A2P5C8S9_PARAD|nr:hypothetical protein PanWU01x14_173640 [Parasponia andersonii]